MEQGMEEKTSAYAWWVFTIIFLYSIIITMFWFAITSSTSVKMMLVMNMLGGDFTQIGVCMNCISYTALIMAFPTGWFIRRFGTRPVTLVSMGFSIAGVVLAALAGMNNYPLMIAGRLCAGVGIGTCGVVCTTLTSVWFSNKSRGLALSLWSIWVPVGMLIVGNGAQALFGEFDFATKACTGVWTSMSDLWWTLAVLEGIVFILAIVFVREPKGSESVGVSTERKSYREIMPWLKQHQVWCLAIVWFAFNFCNQSFGTFNNTYWGLLQESGGFTAEWSASFMTLMTTIASGCGIIAPFFGAVYDRIKNNKKHICIILGVVFLLLFCCFGFRNGDAFFILYLIFQVLGNCLLVACVRPYVPLLLGAAGATAVSFGFACVTFLQQLGNSCVAWILTPVIGALGGAPEAYTQACLYVVIPAAAIALVCSLFIKAGSGPAIKKDNATQNEVEVQA